MGALRTAWELAPGGRGRFLVPVTLDLQVRTVIYVVGGACDATWPEVRKEIERDPRGVNLGDVRLDERDVCHVQWMGPAIEVPKDRVGLAQSSPVRAYGELGGVSPWPKLR